MQRLEYNTRIYNLSKQSLYMTRNHISPSQLFRSIEALALFAVNNPINLFEDQELETLAKHSIKKLYPCKYSQNKYQQGIQLHYATTTYGVGGHSRVIKDWIALNNGTSVFFIRDQKQDISPAFSPAHIISCSSHFDDYISILSSLSDTIFKYNPEKIIFHHHPNDIIPVLLTTLWQGLNSFMYNHADWSFSLSAGNSEIISLNQNHADINKKYRQFSFGIIIPPYTSKKRVSKQLNDRKGPLTICVMGSLHKLSPYKSWNIFQLISMLSKYNQISRINIIGISSSQAPLMMKIFGNSKIIFHGKQFEPDSILASSDIFLEPFPIGSSMATLEAIHLGCYPLFCPTRLLPYHQGAALNYFPYNTTIAYSAIRSMHEFAQFIDDELVDFFAKHDQHRSYQDFISQLNSVFIASINSLTKSPKHQDCRCCNNRFITRSDPYVFENMNRLADHISVTNTTDFSCIYGPRNILLAIRLYIVYLSHNKQATFKFFGQLWALFSLLLYTPFLLLSSRHHVYVSRL